LVDADSVASRLQRLDELRSFAATASEIVAASGDPD
jgi:hypothetical protein